MSDLLTSAELANHLKVPVATIAEWRYKGTGPAYITIGKHRRYSTESVEAWLAAQTVKTA